jgi:uncharacterized protein YjbI with pentapeptide repeats
LPKCQFTTQYYDYEIHKEVDFYCQELPLASGFCIFHDKDYLHHYLFSFREEHKRNVLDRLKRKVKHAISNNETLHCIGFLLPGLSLSDLSISKEFTKPVYFPGSQFFGKTDFSGVKFQQGVHFIRAKFHDLSTFTNVNFAHVDFSHATFEKKAVFRQTIFKEEIDFSYTTFNNEVDFSHATFEKKVKFGKNFGESGKAYFSHTSFN